MVAAGIVEVVDVEGVSTLLASVHRCLIYSVLGVFVLGGVWGTDWGSLVDNFGSRRVVPQCVMRFFLILSGFYSSV